MCYPGKKYVSRVDVFHTASAGPTSGCKRATTILQKTLSRNDRAAYEVAISMVCSDRRIKHKRQYGKCNKRNLCNASMRAVSLCSIYLDSEVGKLARIASSTEISKGRAEFQWCFQVLLKDRPGYLKRWEGRRTGIYGFLKGTMLTLQPFRLTEDSWCCRLSLKDQHLKGGSGQTAASPH